MTHEEWVNKYKDEDIADWLVELQNNTPYTDEEIIEAIEKLYAVGTKCSISLKEVVALITANEMMDFSE